MISKHLMIAVNWYGPYWDLDEVRAEARANWNHGLYMCIGMRPYQRKVSMQYIGIGGAVHTRMTHDHHKLREVTRERAIWLGDIATAEPSGKRLKATKTTLDYAEWVHARFMQLPLNEKKTKNLPSRSVTVLNRWFKTDYETLRKNRPHPDWPDLIDYPDYDMPARMIWFGGRQQYFHAPDYARPEPAVRPSKRVRVSIEVAEQEASED
ncbi:MULTISPECIES: hypothetical protein [Alphaproteobacteria]|uniref:Uncharacterized protein n=2 Tax=Alphaproteobacteria TaxID=28211 RepID=A0A512HJD3_9HYPH|nr:MULTISPECIES: hypothetical protein [Alphaproteobacteria]GEO85545.1 hypothetical protein RNA01_24770 [Ciceribacter naphthalenivorans]GLR22100.1 hypothetical protein GCM10007920_18870 [Ciceribacter naphthalenivorans]GLT04956.1 hypothetical protein GCM10007926_18870 [Sphingomonas psychrolutea]